jgi:hypothetical protein
LEVAVNIGEESEPIEVPIPAHPDHLPAVEPLPEPAPEPEVVPA